MCKIRRTRTFDKDFKKAELNAELVEMLYCLTQDNPLPKKYRDHALTGDFKGFRDCHIRPDLVLIYRIENDILELHHLNSHSEIFR